MCNPLAIGLTMGVMSAANSALEINNANQAASAGTEAANKAALYDYQLSDIQQQQQNEKTTLEKMERMRQAQREESKIRVAAGESGVGGNSPLRQLADSILQNYYDLGILDASQSNTELQNIAQKKSIEAEAQSRINQYKAQYTNPLMSALKIGMSGVSGYGLGRSMKWGR